MNKRLFFHAGDLGDIIAALPAIRLHGGGRLVIGEGPSRESMRGARYNAIRPLIAAQSYIAGVEWSDARPARAVDISSFRQNQVRGENLAHWQGRHLGLQASFDISPWLAVAPDKAARRRVVFARSPRYHNGFFPWFALLKRYPDALFVGTEGEHRDFQQEFGRKLEYRPTRDLLELAAVIAGGRLFCGNQSAPWWIACGLGVATFQESWEHDRNSIVERPNAHYMTGNTFDLEKLPA